MARTREALDFDAIEQAFLNNFEGVTDGEGNSIDLVTFMENENWAKFDLRPRQRLLLKVIHNAHVVSSRAKDLEILPYERSRIDTCKWWIRYREENGEPIKIHNMDHAIIEAADGTWWYDEEADLEYLLSKQNKYANMVMRTEGTPSDPLIIVFILGRGASKTTMASGVGGWKTRHIMGQNDPHGYYGLQAQKSLKVQNVATSELQANEFFQSYKTIVTSIDWFKGRFKDLTGSIEFGEIPGSSAKEKVPQLIAARASSSSSSGRGGDVVVYTHDEMAFSEKGGEGKIGKRSDRSLWRAYFSAVKTRAGSKGIAMTLSSPAEADGLLYELFSQAHNGTLKNVVCVQIATWEMIPGQTKETYESEYQDDPDGAEMEFGAQFYSGDTTLIQNAEEKFAAAVELGKRLGLTRRRSAWYEDQRAFRDGRYQKDQAARFDYACHIDTSKGGDRLFLAVCHMEGPWTVVDHLRVWDKLPHYTKDLQPYIVRLNTAFGGFRQVSFDQYNSLQMIQNLQDLGINCIERTFTSEYNDDLARNLMQLFSDAGVTIAFYPTAVDWKKPLLFPLRGSGWDDDPAREADIGMAIALSELKAVKKIVKAKANSEGKRYVIAAVAPTTGAVIHDDAVDAIGAAALEARLFVMGGGLVDFLSPPGADGEKSAIPIEAIEEGQWIMARCSFCGHSWKEASGDQIVQCPGCGQYPQIRL